ncbi:hypothetical protein FTUN_4073 [Frigoriglobus tundricola]|uniref:Restriction endonuclease domain-containing protein n=1 Tax=Frigoriglobus tundricola TaxID=2774151 RepID=A0A6M5YSX0_9BACT|nr:hypothetical protein FTUN_4073 [Frigoriglobus tundricola]
MIADPDRSELELKYRYSAAAYWFIQRHCHDDVEPKQATQRDITRWAFEVVRGARPDVYPFTNLLIQFTQKGEEEPGQLAPDNSVFVHSTPLKVGVSFDTPFQPVKPFVVMEYTERSRAERYEKELKVPYYLLFYPDADEFTLFRLGEKGYSSVLPNANGRCAIPELELEVALLGGWMRYWFRGELLPLAGDLLKERDAERAARLAAETQANTERSARLAAEAELAKLREELAKAKPQ